MRKKKKTSQPQSQATPSSSTAIVSTPQPPPMVNLARYALFGITVVVLFDGLVITWLFDTPPKYEEPLQSMAIYGMPFLMLGMLFHAQLFYWTDKWSRYYERVYFILKTLLVLPGIVISYAASYRVLGLIDGDKLTTDPSTCLYFSIVTWTTLGYGDVRPAQAARALAASEAIVGYVVMAVFVGLFATLFQYILAKRLPSSGLVARQESD